MTSELQYARKLLMKEGHTMLILSGDSIECFHPVGIRTLLYLLDIIRTY